METAMLDGSREFATTFGPDEQAISFGPFRLLRRQRLLLEAGEPVPLSSRALDILIALVERPGELVGKNELMARVWPNTVVVDENLTVHVASLRRVLGDGQGGNRYLVTIRGRGYCFAAPVELVPGAAPPTLQGIVEGAHGLPISLTRIVGRDDAVAALAAQLPRQRLITIVGAGGIGKTTVALAVAEQSAGAFQHGARFVDLAPLSDPRLVSTALASALGLETRSDDPIPGLIAFLRDRPSLLVLDNCEHVAEAAAAMTAALLKGTAGVHVLATSREPLRAEAEHVHRLTPLRSPPQAARLTAADALAFPAVQLFVERAAAILDGFALSDADAPIVAEICRRLDGIALAIELAAARLDILGVRGLAAGLDDRFRLLTSGRRTALPRQQTLRATLDWSYELLAEQERVVLCRLAIFAGGATLDAASQVATDSDIGASDVVACIAYLVAKSLVVAEFANTTARYRLFDTTRAYAIEKLAQSGEFDEIARRHAHYYRDLFARAEAEWTTRSTAEWLADYSPELDNVRAACAGRFRPAAMPRSA
jgi:predicted ATPase/DNA-binding winged helix-turn-helix (wHTH) protein